MDVVSGMVSCARCSATKHLKVPDYKIFPCWAVVKFAFNPSTWEAEAGRFLSLRLAWSTKWVPGRPGYTEKPCLEKETNKQTNKNSQSSLENCFSGNTNQPCKRCDMYLIAWCPLHCMLDPPLGPLVLESNFKKDSHRLCKRLLR